MGLFGRKNKNQLPKSRINEVTALKYLMTGAEFIVTLPITQLVQTSNGHGLSVRVGFYRQTFYSPPKTEMRFMKVRKIVVYDPDGITIKHAMPNGQHVVVNPKAIAYVTLYTDGVGIELTDGTRYIFAMDKAIQNEWKKLGFNPTIPINVFYNILNGKLPKELQEQFDREAEIERKQSQKQGYQQAMIERHRQMDKRAEENKIRRAKEQQQREREEQETLERQQQLEKEERELTVKENKKIFDEFKVKIKSLKEAYDLEAITQEEYDEIKSTFLNQVLSSPVPEDMNPLVKLKESKELLDIEAITQEEFDKLKSKFLNIVTDSKVYTISKDDGKRVEYDNFIKHGLKVCPHCGEQIPENAIRCRYCKTMLKNYSEDNSMDAPNNVKEDKLDSIAVEQKGQTTSYKIKSSSHKFIICPRCGNKTPIDKNRCQSCDIMINKIMLKNAKKVT